MDINYYDRWIFNPFKQPVTKSDFVLKVLKVLNDSKKALTSRDVALIIYLDNKSWDENKGKKICFVMGEQLAKLYLSGYVAKYKPLMGGLIRWTITPDAKKILETNIKSELEKVENDL